MGLNGYSKGMPKFLNVLSISCALLLFGWCGSSYAVNTDPPAQTHKLVFVHASVGQAWLGRYSGRLGDTLGENNYYVSDWNVYDHPGYGHDYSDWYNTFADGLNLLNSHNANEGNYLRPIPDPGGENDIIMIKPCFLNYIGMSGNPDDPPSGCDPRLAGNNVGDIKQVMLSLLSDIFSQHPEKLFVLVTAPPVDQGNMWQINGALCRPLADWMVHDMLDGYDVGNVMVFDLYNIITSNAEGEGDPCGPPDPELATGNHHRIWNGQIQHQVQYNQSYSAYCEAHPNRDGVLKATAEFVPLLNDFINSRTTTVAPAAPRNLRIIATTN